MLTNGRVLSRAAYAEAVVRLGLDEIVVRVHGADAARADGATGVPGSFRQAVLGVAALSRRKQAYGLELGGPPRSAEERREILAAVERAVGQAVQQAVRQVQPRP